MTSTARAEYNKPTLAGAARAAAEKEWHVFPLAPLTKRPLTETGFKEAT